MAEPRRKLAPMAAWNAGAWIGAALYGFVATRLIVQHVGEEAYGVWATIAAVRGFVTFLDGGLAFGVNRDAARLAAAPDEAAVRIRATRRVYAVLALLAGAGFAAASGFPAALLDLGGTDAATAGAVMRLLGLETAMALLASPYLAVLRGRERFDLLAASVWLQTALGIGLLLWLTPRHGLEGAAWAALATRAASFVGVWALLRARGLLPATAGRAPRGTLRAVLGFAAPLWLVAAGTQLGAGTDVPVVGGFHGAEEAGHYALGAALPTVASGLLFAIMGASFPRMVAAREGERHEITGALLFMATFLAAAGFGFLALHEAALLTVWVGTAPALAVDVAALMCVCWTINAPTHVLASQAIARDTHRVLGLVVLAEALVNLAASVVLAMLWSPIGPAVATLATIFVSNGLVMPALLRRRLGLGWSHIARPTLFGLLLGGAAAAAVRGVTWLAQGDAHVSAGIGAALTIAAAVAVLDLTVRSTSTLRRLAKIARRGGFRVLARQRREVAQERARLERVRRESPIVWTKSTPPLVTVRIATYNRGRLVADRAIASALAQTHANLEVLVVGDHCDEATAAAVRSVRDPRVRFENLPERGRYPDDPELRWMVAGAAPMNRALELARGEWIAPLDDDDEFTPDHVEALLDACRSRDLEFAYGVSENEQPDGTFERCGSWPIRHGFIVHAAVLYWSGLRFTHDVEAWRIDEPGDWNLWSRMRRAGVRMGFVDHVVARHYRERREIAVKRPFFLG